MLVNNLSTHRLLPRDGGTASVDAGNVDAAAASEFQDLPNYNVHLAAGASAAGSGDPQGLTHAPEDFDQENRPSPPSVGADEP